MPCAADVGPSTRRRRREVGGRRPEEDLDERALARAVRADKADDPGLEVERQAVERGDVARIALGQGVGGDEGHVRPSLADAARGPSRDGRGTSQPVVASASMTSPEGAHAIARSPSAHRHHPDHRGDRRRDGTVIEDLTYPGPDGQAVAAYLVRPGTSPGDGAGGASAGLLAWHWFDTEAPDGDRTQFRDEAVELAGQGVVSLLPQGRFPWSAPPTGSAADAAAIREEVARLRLGLDLLARTPAVDPTRLAVVGHDFGGMLAAVAAAEEDRLRALVLIAATPRWGDWFLPFWPIEEDRIDYLRAIRPLDPIERIGDAAPAAVLMQFGRRDFFIAADVGARVPRRRAGGHRAQAYDAEHDMRLPEIRADRRAFLARHLGVAET